MTAHKEYVINKNLRQIGKYRKYNSAEDGPEVSTIKNFRVFPEGWRSLGWVSLQDLIQRRQKCGFNV